MTLWKSYSANEVFARLVQLMKGVDLADDTPGLFGSAAWNESLSEILELCQNSYPGVTGVFPYGLHAQTENIEDAHTSLHGSDSAALSKKDHRWVSGTFDAVPADQIILCAIGAFTGTMYTAVGNSGREVTIKNAGTGTVQVNPATGTSETVEGSSVALTENQATLLYSDGVNWYELADI